MTVHIHNIILIPDNVYDNMSPCIEAWFAFVDHVFEQYKNYKVFGPNVSDLRRHLTQFDATIVGDYHVDSHNEVLFFSTSGYSSFLLTYMESESHDYSYF